jgi:hypothetical protein
VPEQVGDLAQAGAPVEQTGGQRMPQQVRPARRRIHAGPHKRGVHGAADDVAADRRARALAM